MMTKDFFKDRPLSWSGLSSFEYSPEQWYRKYILGEKDPESKEMMFGKHFARAIELYKEQHPKAIKFDITVKGQTVEVNTFSKVEQPFKILFGGDIPLIGFADSFCDKTKKKFREFKTGKAEWTQKRADEHGQILMYMLMNYVTNQVRPEDTTFYLDWYPTEETGDFAIGFKTTKPKTFRVKYTTLDILQFGARINKTVNQMIEYANQKENKIT